MQILTKVVSVIYCSASGSNGILCFLVITLIFVPSVVTVSSKKKIMLKVLFVMKM